MSECKALGLKVWGQHFLSVLASYFQSKSRRRKKTFYSQHDCLALGLFIPPPRYLIDICVLFIWKVDILIVSSDHLRSNLADERNGMPPSEKSKK